MRKSVFSEIFSLCVAVFSASLICIGAIILVASSEYYKSDKFDYMKKQSDILLEATLSSASNGTLDTEKLKDVYDTISKYIDMDITLTDSDGVALVCSEASPCSHTEKRLRANTISRITENGLYELGNLDGYYDKNCFYFLLETSINDENFYLMAGSRTNHLVSYMTVIIIVYLVSAAIIMSVALTIVYTSSKRLLMPIKEMTIAARCFGDGDFKAKLNIADENELGFLANSLNEMAASLEEIEKSRKSFISNVSHELKTPMTTIGGFIDGILDGTIPPDQHKRYLRIVSKEVSRLSRLVRSMLNISKFEAGELTLSTKDFDMLLLIIQTLMNFEKRIEEKHIDIQGLDTDAFLVNGDPDLIQQVVYNLVENAVKYVNEDGYIRFGFEENKDGMCIISIQNSGDGLTEYEISKVFDRFYKTDESRGIDPGGVGLGLSIVSSIIKLHNGTIIVKSEPKHFTEFSFSLKKAECNRK